VIKLAALTLICSKMIQLQTMRLSSLNALTVSARKNVILTHEEAESGAVTADDLGMFDNKSNLYYRGRR
jgi:hypothetical protein